MTQVNQVSTKVTPFDGEEAAKVARVLASEAGDLTAVLDCIADAKVEVAGGSVNTMIMLRNIYGDRLDAMPRPGEKEGNNRDEISLPVEKDGTTKSVKTTFYTVFSDSTPGGKAIVDRIELCNRAKRSDTVKTDIPADIIEMADKNLIGREIDRLTTKRGTYRASIKRAMELVFQFAAVNEVPLIEAEPIWEDGHEGEKVMAVTACIQVWQMNEDGKRVKYTKDYTVGAFLKLKADKATENGGGFKALDATLQRGTKGTVVQNTTAADRRIASMDTMVGVTTELHRYLDEIILNKDQAEFSRLVKNFKSPKVTGETITSFVELRNFLTDIIEASDFQPRYNKLQQSEAA